MSEEVINAEIHTEKSSKEKSDLPAKRNGFWPSVKAILFREIEVTLSPRQQKIEDFLNKPIEVTMTPKQEKIINKMKAFLFQEVTFSKNKKNKDNINKK